MDGDGQSASASTSDLSSILGGAGSTIGAGAAQSVIDAANGAIPDLSFAAGQNAAQGAISAVSPYLPFIAIGIVALVLLSGR